MTLTLDQIAERLLDASGPDAALDEAIERTIALGGRVRPEVPVDGPRYTGDIEIAFMFVERELPGATVTLRKSTAGYWAQGLWGAIINDGPGWTVMPTAPLALVMATIRCLQAKRSIDSRDEEGSADA